MLRLDSSEMLPGSQKGANRGLRQKSWTHTRGSAILTPAGAWNVGTGNDHVTQADCHVPHSAHLGTVLRASSIYSRPSLVGRHIGTTYVTWSAVDKMADVNTPAHSVHLGTFGSPRKFPFRALTSHSAHLGSFRSVHEARSRLQFRGVLNARRSSCRHIWSADTVASVKQIL